MQGEKEDPLEGLDYLIKLNKKAKKNKSVQGAALSETSKPIGKRQAKPLKNNKKEVEEIKENKQSRSLSSNLSSYPP